MSVDFPGLGKCEYTGEINSCDQPHGYGTVVRGDGYRYEGTYQDGSLVTGKLFWSDGFLDYEGEFKGGRRHGAGTVFHKDGMVETGRYEEGRLKDGTVTFPSGRVEKFVNGERVSECCACVVM